MPSVSWPILPSISLRLLGRSNSELYLTSREKGPGSELTPLPVQPRSGSWQRRGETQVVSVYGWNFLLVFETDRLLVCAPCQQWSPLNSIHQHQLISMVYHILLSSHVIRLHKSDQVALNEGRKGEEAVCTKWSTLWKKKQILLGCKLEEKTLKINRDYNGGLMCSWFYFLCYAHLYFSLNICKILLLESHKRN